VKVVVVGWKLQYPLAHLNRLLGLEQPKGPQDDPEVKGWLQGLPSGSRRLLRLPAHGLLLWLSKRVTVARASGGFHAGETDDGAR
jgi:hypothetical protein